MEQALRYPPVLHTMEGHKQIHNGGNGYFLKWVLQQSFCDPWTNHELPLSKKGQKGELHKGTQHKKKNNHKA